MREPHEPLIKTPTRLLAGSGCTGRIFLAVITAMVLFAFVAMVQEAQAVVTTVTSNVNPGWTNNRQEVVFYNGDRFYLLYSKGGGEIFYKSSRDNVTWSGESTLISGASSTFNTYLVDDTKFDLTYRGFPSYTFVRTCTISCGAISCGSASTVETAMHTAVAVARSGGDRIYFVGQFNSDYLRMYSANQTGDASSSMTWTQRVNDTGADPTHVAAVPYQSADKVLAVYQHDGGGTGSDGVRSIVVTASGNEGEKVLKDYGNLPDFSNPIRISDTDFRIIVRPPGAGMEEWKWNGSAWSQVDTNIDPQGETDQNSPSLFYDRISGDMYVFSEDYNVERHYKPSGGSWATEEDADGEVGVAFYSYPTTQMHEPPPDSGRTVPRELVWAFRVVNGSNYDLKVGNLNLASPAAPSVAGYTCYRTIRVDHNKISGTTPLTDFPLLVKFENDSNLATGTCGWVKNTDGWDIMFTDDSATPTVQYDHEIEKFDGTAGTLFAWVRIPSLSATAYTDLRMWYGKSGAADSSNPTGVWDCNYKGVYHLQEDPSGTAPQMKDSTTNANHGTTYGSMTSGDQVAGKIGGSLDFDGSNDEVKFPDPIIGDSAAWTITAWIKMGADTSDQRTIYSEAHETAYNGYSFLYVDDSNNYVKYYNENNYEVLSGSTNVEDNQFHHVAMVQRSTTDRELIVDNVSQDSGTTSIGTLTYNTASIGYLRAEGWTADPFKGIIDEVRISDVGRSDAWIEAEYNNATDSSFYSVTYESCGAPSEDPNTFSCSRTIRVDHTKVSDLDGVSYYENFPMLVKFTGDNTLKFGSCGRIKYADASDIIFTDSNGYVLDHEIESYDGDTGTLVAWVKIPQLYTGQATDIYMYYGKEVLQCATENPTGVWDDDYVGVWHFKEGSGSGSYLKNSKQNAYHADPDYSSAFVEDAKIAGGRDVNQIDFDSGGDLLDGDTAFTLSFWGYPNYASDAEWQADEAHMFNTDSIWGLRWSRNSGNDPGTGWIQADVRFTSGTNYFNDWNHLLRAEWNHIVLNYNGSALRLYINGSMVKQSTGYTGQALVSNSTACLGYCWGGGGGGYVDELRYSRSARTAGWIATEYANQNDPGSFYEKIDDTCESGGGGTYDYCKKIIIDRGNVTAPASPGYLANFPFLLKITNNNDLKNGVTSAEGWDIIFLGDSCTPLSHEIESYDADTGSLVAWVKIPQLNGSGLSSDTVIYMKYGNESVVCDNDDPPGVWDSNYVGVYHLKDLTTSTTKDSTSNSNDGTKKAANEPVEVDGYIEKAQNFGNDGGVDDHIDISTVSDDVDVDAGTFELWLKREFDDAASGGVTSDTIEVRVSSSYDDAEQYVSSGSMMRGSSDLEMVQEDYLQTVGMRWQNVTIPQGATITNAYIEFTVDETDSETTNLTFWGEDADNPGAFQSTSYNISNRTKTSASVNWNVPSWSSTGVTHQSPDIKTVIQEIVNRGGWSSGNALVVIVTGSGKRVAEAYDGSTSQAPLLHVDYETTGGTAPTMSIMRVDTDSQNGITFAYDQEIEKFRFRHEAGDTEIKVERASSEIPQNTWTHAAMTWDKNGGASGEFKAYINGSQVGSTQTGLGTWAGSVAYGDLGRKYGNQEYYDGSLDEARISDIARSAEWIETAYDNQNNPESFITLGSCINNTIAVEDQWEEKF